MKSFRLEMFCCVLKIAEARDARDGLSRYRGLSFTGRKDVQLWTQVLIRFRLGWVVTSVLS